jgi:hypothetical protein
MQAEICPPASNVATTSAPVDGASAGRVRAGWIVLIVALALPALALGVPFLGLSATSSTLLITALVAGGPEVLLLVAAALLGREAFDAILGRVKRWFWSAPTSDATATHASTAHDELGTRGLLPTKAKRSTHDLFRWSSAGPCEPWLM